MSSSCTPLLGGHIQKNGDSITSGSPVGETGIGDTGDAVDTGDLGDTNDIGDLRIHEGKLHSHTKRLLKSRHISMISIGGIIGTGLFIGIRNTLTIGPIVALLSYVYIAVMCYTVVQSVGEMSCFMPCNGSLCQFQFKFLSNSVGLSINLIYWMSWSITLALELSLMYSILSYWKTYFPWIENHQLSVILFFWLVLTLFNLFPVNYYGEIEFSVTIIKVLFLLTWILVASCLVWYKDVGFKYWNPDLRWGVDTIHVISNHVGSKLLNIGSSLVAACFTFQSIESIAICSGEIENVHVNLPKSIRYVLVRIVVFYILTLSLLTLLIPCNDPRLLDSDDDIFSSPFILALETTSPFLLGCFNLVILISMISAANSNIYFGSRCLISISESGYLPLWIRQTSSQGVPYNAVIITSSLGLLSLMLKFRSLNVVFNLLINICATSGLIMWLFILISYIRFLASLKFNGLSYTKLAFRSLHPSFLMALNYFNIGSIITIIVINGAINIWSFSWDNFISAYLTLFTLVVSSLLLSYYWNEPLLKPLSSIDIFTDQSPRAFCKNKRSEDFRD